MTAARLTRRSRGIHAAWHFWHAVGFGGESGVRKVSLCGIHPLTRRYTARRKNDTKWNRVSSYRESD
ncbi:TPA: DUF3265 domain-containing protein [Vibrio vulnificus]|nr:DUF3265 domain-containing protein [Vibrio vulnificus]